MLEGSSFTVDTTGGTRSMYSWLEQEVGDVQGKLAQLLLRHAVPLKFPAAGKNVKNTESVPHVTKNPCTNCLNICELGNQTRSYLCDFTGGL